MTLCASKHKNRKPETKSNRLSEGKQGCLRTVRSRLQPQVVDQTLLLCLALPRGTHTSAACSLTLCPSPGPGAGGLVLDGPLPLTSCDWAALSSFHAVIHASLHSFRGHRWRPGCACGSLCPHVLVKGSAPGQLSVEIIIHFTCPTSFEN